ncbi:MAG TPA: septum formation family protein [Jatrophihabitans sp.]|jgi:hypothetical protein
MSVRTLRLCALIVVVLALSACSPFGRGKQKTSSVSVFSVKPGECFGAPGSVKTELSSLTRTPCTSAHAQEAYALVTYHAADGSTPTTYPGADALTNFAQGSCAQRFGDYVGVQYLDSSLFFTYLLPSARSWENQSDHDTICFVTTAGGTLTASVKGSKK